MNLLDKVLRTVGVFNVDPSDIQVYICDTLMEDITKFTLRPTEKRRTETGINSVYHTYVTIPHHYKATIDVLPESHDMYFLHRLDNAIGVVGSYFEMTVIYNGRNLGIFDCYTEKEADEDFSTESGDTSFEIVCVRQTEQYIAMDDELELSEGELNG